MYKTCLPIRQGSYVNKLHNVSVLWKWKLLTTNDYTALTARQTLVNTSHTLPDFKILTRVSGCHCFINFKAIVLLSILAGGVWKGYFAGNGCF